MPLLARHLRPVAGHERSPEPPRPVLASRIASAFLAGALFLELTGALNICVTAADGCAGSALGTTKSNLGCSRDR